MTSTTLTATENGVFSQTAAANTTDTITFQGRWSKIRVIQESEVAFVVTFDGTDPDTTTPGTTAQHFMPPIKSVEDFDVPFAAPVLTNGHYVPGAATTTVVKVKSAGTPTYSIIGL